MYDTSTLSWVVRGEMGIDAIDARATCGAYTVWFPQISRDIYGIPFRITGGNYGIFRQNNRFMTGRNGNSCCVLIWNT